MTDVIIIGGGPAGMTAAIYALRGGKSVLIIEKEAFGGQIASSPRVENLPSLKVVSGLDFADQLFDQISDLGVEFELEDVLGIKKENGIFTVITNYGEHHAKSVIIANGLKHRHTGLASEDVYAGKGISYCATCDGAFYKGKDVVLIGDANTALQYAILLANYCNKVSVCTLFDKFFADDILVKRLKELPNVEYRHNLSVQEFKGNGKELNEVVFKDTKIDEIVSYQCAGCFVAIGQIPNNDAFKDYVDLEKGFILTNELMETKTPGLFAAGDTRLKAVKQVVTAANDGAVAAVGAIKYIDQ